MIARTLLLATLPAMFLAPPTRAQSCDPTEVAKLLPSDGWAYDYFGYSVASTGDTLIVGTLDDGYNGSDPGSAYVFRFDGAAWLEQVELLASDGAGYDNFGTSVAISADTVIIGAYCDDDKGTNSGSAYVFRFDGSAWVEQAKLLASDGAAYDAFGLSVANWGGTAVIGALNHGDFGSRFGSAYVFRLGGNGWAEETELLASDGADNDAFGCSVAVSDGTVVVGARANGVNGTGSVYVFRFDGAAWVEQAKLSPSDGASGDQFGCSVAISGDTILIGAFRDGDNGLGSGSAYVFRFDGAEWLEQAKLSPSDGASGDNFGVSVAISGETAIIGAYGDDDKGINSGSAYAFRFNGTEWVESAKLLASDGGVHNLLGTAVAVSGDTVFVGAPGDFDSPPSAAYVFDLACACPADLNGDGVVDTRDFLLFLGAWSQGDSLADWDGNGVINTLDFLAYLNDWSAGC